MLNNDDSCKVCLCEAFLGLRIIKLPACMWTFFFLLPLANGADGETNSAHVYFKSGTARTAPSVFSSAAQRAGAQHSSNRLQALQQVTSRWQCSSMVWQNTLTQHFVRNIVRILSSLLSEQPQVFVAWASRRDFALWNGAFLCWRPLEEGKWCP